MERGIASQADREALSGNRPITSNYFDLSQLEDYWSERRLNHHTEATTMLYALREGVRLVLEEGLEARFERHRHHEAALAAGIKAMGLRLFGDDSCKMPVVTCVEIPGGIDGESVRGMLLAQFGIEIARLIRPARREDLENRHDGVQLQKRKRAIRACRVRGCASQT